MSAAGSRITTSATAGSSRWAARADRVRPSRSRLPRPATRASPLARSPRALRSTYEPVRRERDRVSPRQPAPLHGRDLARIRQPARPDRTSERALASPRPAGDGASPLGRPRPRRRRALPGVDAHTAATWIRRNMATRPGRTSASSGSGLRGRVDRPAATDMSPAAPCASTSHYGRQPPRCRSFDSDWAGAEYAPVWNGYMDARFARASRQPPPYWALSDPARLGVGLPPSGYRIQQVSRG